MKNFVKAMDREGSSFACLKKFPWISTEKLKAGIFDGSQIREPMKEPIFDEALSKTELSVRQALKSVVTNFLGNHWSAQYEKEIERLLKTFPLTQDTNVSQTALSAVALEPFKKTAEI